MLKTVPASPDLLQRLAPNGKHEKRVFGFFVVGGGVFNFGKVIQYKETYAIADPSHLIKHSNAINYFIF